MTRPPFCVISRCVPVAECALEAADLERGESEFCLGRHPGESWTADMVKHENDLALCMYTPFKGWLRFVMNDNDLTILQKLIERLREKRGGRKRRVLLGNVPVDSGSLAVGDPGYLGVYHLLPGDLVRLLEGPDQGGLYGDYVVCNSGLGDGEYAVWADIEDCGEQGERITRLEVVLIAPEEAAKLRREAEPAVMIPNEERSEEKC